MVFSWLKSRRRKELLKEAFPAAWREYVGLGQYELAKADLDYVLRMNRNDAEAYRLRGSALLGPRQSERAVSDLSMSIAQYPLSAEAYYERGLAYRALGRIEDADADFERARQLDPRAEGRRE